MGKEKKGERKEKKEEWEKIEIKIFFYYLCGTSRACKNRKKKHHYKHQQKYPTYRTNGKQQYKGQRHHTGLQY